MNFKSNSNWGDRSGSQLKGPHWSPYAQAIADEYPIQIPWYCTLPSNLTGGFGPLGRRSALTPPQQHDVLLFGAYAIITEFFDVDEGNYLFLQITPDESGVPWVVPNSIGGAPLPSIAGVVNPVAFPDEPNRTTVMKLPEAFFLSKGTRLKLDWLGVFSPGFPANASALITFVGVRLIGGKPPKEIHMPDGKMIPIGARLPWFITIPLGERIRVPNDILFSNNTEYVQFTSPQDCDIEIHDTYHNTIFLPDATASSTRLKFTEMGDKGIWTPTPTPMRAVFGDERKVDPALPLTKPYLLKAGHKIGVVERLQAPTGFGVFMPTLTFRGVRLCKY